MTVGCVIADRIAEVILPVDAKFLTAELLFTLESISAALSSVNAEQPKVAAFEMRMAYLRLGRLVKRMEQAAMLVDG
jgi:hypothetical protein